MGAAIEVFEGARALQVPRSRFAPVKSNNDLLVVRSDVYQLNGDFTITVSPQRQLAGIPSVSLDTHFYGLLRDFEARMKEVPSLVDAQSFVVKGDVVFPHPVKIVGAVTVSGSQGAQRSVPPGVSALQSQEMSL